MLHLHLVQFYDFFFFREGSLIVIFVVIFSRPTTTETTDQGSSFLNSIADVLVDGLADNTNVTVIGLSPVEGMQLFIFFKSISKL